MINFFKQEIVDLFTRENFFKLENYFRTDPFRKGNFKFMEIVSPGVWASKAVAHNLKFTPKDIIPLSVASPDGVTVTWHYDDFTSDNLYISTSGACTIRAYVGRYEES